MPAIVYAGPRPRSSPTSSAATSSLPTYAEYYFFITAAIVVFTALVAPPRCSAPTGAPACWASTSPSPLTRTTYLLAKATAVLGVLAIVTLGPRCSCSRLRARGRRLTGLPTWRSSPLRIVVAGTLLSAFRLALHGRVERD